ncbi:MAG TPA: discoidin domain-containing protein [Planctomycetota bacterium]|jgi:hypothetical protein
MKPNVWFITAILVLPISAVWPAEDGPPNLARIKGATPIGSGSNGPFGIAKLNDGRTDSLGMWSSDGKDGAFGGIKFGQQPVTFNTVRFYLFNGRAAFTGWRLESSDDAEVDDDPDPGVSPGFAVVNESALIAADPHGQFVNSSAKAHNVVTISFHPTKAQSVRIVFSKLGSSPRPSVGVPELEVFQCTDNATPRAALSAHDGIAIDNASHVINLPKAITLSELLVNLAAPAGVTVFAHDLSGKVLAPADLLTSSAVIVAKFQTGGQNAPFETEYACYAIVDSSAPAPAPQPAKAPRAPRPPKPPVTVASVPDAPKDTVNLVIGKKFSGSIRPESGAKFSATGSGDWFLTQQIPQWISVDFDVETEFNYFGLGSAQAVHFAVQTSNDATTWKTLVEVDRLRPPYSWNGYFDKTKARHLRLVILKPSWDVHIRRIMVANLVAPLLNADGKPVPAIQPPVGETLDLSKLPR